MTLNSFFSSLINEYSKLFQYMYPCPDQNGFSEASLTSHCLREIPKVKGYEDLVFWDEFNLTGEGRCDSAIFCPSSKEIIIIEAKNLQTDLGNAPSMAADIERCYATAKNADIFPRRIWKDADNHHAGHIPLRDYENEYTIYGFAIGTFWLSASATRVQAEKAFYHSLWNNLQSVPKGELLVEHIDVQNPHIKEQLFIGALFWMIKEKGESLNSINPVLKVPPKTGREALDFYFGSLTGTMDVVKACKTYTYLWPSLFSNQMPNKKSNPKNNLQFWIDYTTSKIVLVVAHKLKSLSVSGPNLQWLDLKAMGRCPYSLGSVASALGVELGDKTDLETETNVAKVKAQVLSALADLQRLIMN